MFKQGDIFLRKDGSIWMARGESFKDKYLLKLRLPIRCINNNFSKIFNMGECYNDPISYFNAGLEKIYTLITEGECNRLINNVDKFTTSDDMKSILKTIRGDNY